MKVISVTEFKRWQAQGKAYQLIDVREPDEFAKVNMGGLLIPLARVLDDADQIQKDIPVVLHCRSGKRSEMALRLLERDLGYTNLYNLAGGIMAWSDSQGQTSDNHK